MSRPSLWSLFLSFLKIGSTAFGGFMALISVVQNEIVERKKLLTHSDIVDGISLATILRGGLGALVSAVAVLLPAFVLIVALSAVYFRWGQIPTVNKLFLGFIPAVTAVIVHAAWGMARKAIRGLREFAIAFIACLLLLYKGGFYITLTIIVSAGLIGWLLFARFSDLSAGTAEAKPVQKRNGAKLLALNAPLAVAPFLALDAGLAVKLFLTFAGMSVLLFGGGFVFIPLIEQIVVQEQGWLTRQEFIDAIAMGQITPGPILISAAFIGIGPGVIWPIAMASMNSWRVSQPCSCTTICSIKGIKTKPPPNSSTLIPANVRNNFTARPASKAKKGATASGALRASSFAPFLFCTGLASAVPADKSENRANNSQPIRPALTMIVKVI